MLFSLIGVIDTGKAEVTLVLKPNWLIESFVDAGAVAAAAVFTPRFDGVLVVTEFSNNLFLAPAFVGRGICSFKFGFILLNSPLTLLELLPSGVNGIAAPFLSNTTPDFPSLGLLFMLGFPTIPIGLLNDGVSSFLSTVFDIGFIIGGAELPPRCEAVDIVGEIFNGLFGELPLANNLDGDGVR